MASGVTSAIFDSPDRDLAAEESLPDSTSLSVRCWDSKWRRGLAVGQGILGYDSKIARAFCADLEAIAGRSPTLGSASISRSVESLGLAR